MQEKLELSELKQDKFQDLGREDLKYINMENYRTLSPYICLVGTLHSKKWYYKKLVNGESVESGKTVGYRFKTSKDISITRYQIIKGSKAYTTDPSCYKRVDGSFDIKAGTIFDLNLFETMIFFMRDDIFGVISGGDFDVCLFTRCTNKSYVTAGLKGSGNNSIKTNEIYIDEKVNGELVLKEGFEQYSSLYERTKNAPKKEDIQAVNVLSLRKVIDERMWR